MPVKGVLHSVKTLRISPSTHSHSIVPRRAWCPVIPIRILNLVLFYQKPILLTPRSQLNGVRTARRPVQLLTGNRGSEESDIPVLLKELRNCHFLWADRLVHLSMLIFRLIVRVKPEKK